MYNYFLFISVCVKAYINGKMSRKSRVTHRRLEDGDDDDVCVCVVGIQIV